MPANETIVMIDATTVNRTKANKAANVYFRNDFIKFCINYIIIMFMCAQRYNNPIINARNKQKKKKNEKKL